MSTPVSDAGRTPSIARTVAENVRIFAAAFNVPQNAVGHALGLSKSAISKRWNGDQDYRLDELGLIADLFAIPVAELITPRKMPARRLRAVTENTDEARGDSRASDRLPRLDSNQQPSDYMSGLIMAPILELPLGRNVKHASGVTGELAPVVSLAARLGA